MINGKECRRRALLETERRFFGNSGEDFLGYTAMEAKLKLNDRELATLMLDKRTCMQKTVMKTHNDWIKSEEALSKYYIEFFCNCRAFDRLKKANNVETLPDDNKNNGGNDIEEVDSDCDDLIEFDHDKENTVNLNIRSEQELRESDVIKARQEFWKVIKTGEV